MRSKDWKTILTGLTLATPIPMVARAETYLTEDQAAAVLFPVAANRMVVMVRRVRWLLHILCLPLVLT